MARRRLFLAFVLSLGTAAGAAAQAPAAQPPAATIEQDINQLSNFDFDARNVASRRLRRVDAAQAVPALTAAVKNHTDQFVRFRALVLLTGFNDRGTPDLMRTLVADKSDRIREVAYRWFAAHPEPSLVPTLLERLQTETAEFVRPALVAALAAVGSDPQVQRPMIAEAGRGMDFFRIAVIEALGRNHAAYAADAIADAAKNEGPLQDDAVLALARIGDKRALAVTPPAGDAGAEVAATLHAANCLLGGDCAAEAKALVDAAAKGETPQVIQASVTALAAIAAKPDTAATSQLVQIARTGSTVASDQALVEFSIMAVRDPQQVLAWLDTVTDPEIHDQVIELLATGFERLEEDFAEEQFYGAARAAYWAAPEGSPVRTRMAAIIDALQF